VVDFWWLCENDLFIFYFFGNSSLWVVDCGSIYVELGFGFWLVARKRGCFGDWVVSMGFEWVAVLAMFWLGRY